MASKVAAAVSKRFCAVPVEHKQLSKKEIEKEQARKRLEEMLKKEARIAAARERRALLFKEKGKIAGKIRALQVQKPLPSFETKPVASEAKLDQLKKKALMEEVKNEERKKVLMETENRIEEARLRRARHLAEKAERTNVLKCILKKEADRANSYGFSQDFASKYELLDRIGTGTYGTVFKARVKDIPHAPLVAVKAIVKALMNTPAKVAAVKKEALILEILSGKTNMVKFSWSLRRFGSRLLCHGVM